VTIPSDAGTPEVVSRRPGWWVVVLAAVGVGVLGGAALHAWLDEGGSEGGEPRVVAFGCRGSVTLVVDAEDLSHDAYELRATLGDDRMLPLINAMTEPIVGQHRNHQYIEPDKGRLLVAANWISTQVSVEYELVAVGGSGLTAQGRTAIRPCESP